MSTKIYNGFKLADRPLYFHEVNEMLDPVRSILASQATDAIAKDVVRSAFGLMDRIVARSLGYQITERDVEQENSTRSCLGTASKIVREFIEKDSAQGLRNRLDPEASVSVYTTEEGTYALLFAQHKDKHKIFKDVLGAQEYNYWNNSDHDESVPYDLWEQRGQVWDKLVGHDRASAKGAHFELVSKDIVWYPHPILVYPKEGVKEHDIPTDWIPDFDNRMHQLGLSLPEAQLPPDLALEQSKSNSVSISMRHIRDLEEGKVPQFNEAVSRLKQDMPREYSLGQLRTELSEVHTLFSPKKKTSRAP